MRKISFEEAIARIVARDDRFDPEAYRFLRRALDFTVEFYEKPATGKARHVSGAELLDGVRRMALKEFGPMALRVLRTWGVTRTEDIGAMVFYLVESGVLGKTDRDRIEDFANGYSFEDAYATPFRPRRARRSGEVAPSAIQTPPEATRHD